jgi:hypothetical protein
MFCLKIPKKCFTASHWRISYLCSGSVFNQVRVLCVDNIKIYSTMLIKNLLTFFSSPITGKKWQQQLKNKFKAVNLMNSNRYICKKFSIIRASWKGWARFYQSSPCWVARTPWGVQVPASLCFEKSAKNWKKSPNFGRRVASLWLFQPRLQGSFSKGWARQ